LAAFAIPPVPETVLVVDDDKDMCWVLEVALASLGCSVTTVESARSAISSVAEWAFPIAFVDARLPDMDGLRLIEELRRLRPAMRVIMSLVTISRTTCAYRTRYVPARSTVSLQNRFKSMQSRLR